MNININWDGYMFIIFCLYFVKKYGFRSGKYIMFV